MLFKKRFSLATQQSPSYFNIANELSQLGWKNTRTQLLSQFDERNFSYNPEATQALEFKHLLNNLNTEYKLGLLPQTYNINDENWPNVLSMLDNERRWILKPSTLNNGEHIHIFTSIADIERHYLRSNRMGGEHVIQEYISHPHLLKGPSAGHKYSIRLFVVLTNYSGNYLYPEGYFNIALTPYEANDFREIGAHITNEHLHHDKHNVIQIPTTQYDIFKPFYPEIKKALSLTTNALNDKFASGFLADKYKKIALFGFDFLIDQHEKLWMLEANHAPCFPTSPTHPLHQKLYKHFWSSLVDKFILPIANKTKNIKMDPFEKL